MASTLLEDFSIQLRGQARPATSLVGSARAPGRKRAYLPLLKALENLLRGGDAVAAAAEDGGANLVYPDCPPLPA